MGEYAEMMLDGTLCEGCGIPLGSGGLGPRRCAGCAPYYQHGPVISYPASTRPDPRRKIACSLGCGRKFKTEGAMEQHIQVYHGKGPEA